MPKRRNKSIRSLPPVFHIYCEGEKTEPSYFRCYIDKNHMGDKRLRVEKTNKNTPIQLVEEAVKAKLDKSCPAGDVFWVVYDREREARYSNERHREACQLANKYGVNVAISNVCFELWILLHFEMNTAAYGCCDDLINKSNLKKKHIKNYDKSDTSSMDAVVDAVNLAKNNAIKMNKETRKAADPDWVMPYQFNPYTNVYKLIDAIDEFMK